MLRAEIKSVLTTTEDHRLIRVTEGMSVKRLTMLLFVCYIIVFMVSTLAAESLPAFPGAEGFGAVSVGGRGGRVVHVVNLDDSGPGSFRAALNEKGPRIIVFDVGGTIELRSNLRMPNENGFVTIDGQTAPGGITLIGAEVGIPGWSRTNLGTSDIIVRHLRVRGVHNTASPGQGGDPFSSFGSKRVMIDHCSFTGACDETVDIIHSRDVTIQWCVIEEPALWGQGGAQHSEGNHNTGLISSYPPAGNVSFHHNLFAHCSRRNPLSTLGPVDIRNNVVYNFKIGLSGSGKRRYAGSILDFNVVGNYYRRGGDPPRYVTPFYSLGDGRYYFADNVFDIRDDVSLTISDPWKDLPEANRQYGGTSFWGGGERLSAEVKVPTVTTHSAKEAYQLVLASAGAWPRDATTRRIVREVKTRTGEFGLSGPYERLATRTQGPTSAKHDTDRDGMPDAWEESHGLNPENPSDGNKIVPRGASTGDRHAGYTYVEYFLNELADKIVGVDDELCTVTVRVDGPGLVVCEHGGHTPNWRAEPHNKKLGHQGNPLEIAWGKTNVFNKGSTVVLKALPQNELGVGAPLISRFTHWSGGFVDGLEKSTVRLQVNQDVIITAHFRRLQ